MNRTKSLRSDQSNSWPTEIDFESLDTTNTTMGVLYWIKQKRKRWELGLVVVLNIEKVGLFLLKISAS